MNVFASLQNFMSLRFKSLTPPISMPQKKNHDLKEKYPSVPFGTLEPIMRAQDILT